MILRRVLAAIAVSLAVFAAAMFIVLALGFLFEARAACEEYPPNPPHEPSGVKGCELYGEGIASTYPGPGVARNDCVWPWTACTPIRITAVETGRTITATPTMYCDCYMRPGPNGEQPRIVDLPPDALAALGLDPSRGLWPVRVEPATGVLEAPAMLPDTATGD